MTPELPPMSDDPPSLTVFVAVGVTRERHIDFELTPEHAAVTASHHEAQQRDHVLGTVPEWCRIGAPNAVPFLHSLN